MIRTESFTMPRALRAAAGLMLCAGLAMPATFTASAAQAPSVRVEIAKFAFAPKDIVVTPGTTVVWTNHDDTPHTVASADRSFVSKGMDTDDRYAHTFDREGDFGYICSVHPFMTGVVHVHGK